MDEWNENADREREGREKVTSRPLGKRVARKTKIELVNRFDNRWQSKEWKISIEWNLFNQKQKSNNEEDYQNLFINKIKKERDDDGDDQIKFFFTRARMHP